MFVELHMIQNFAPANLNRDDTNNPKDCEFGGVRRARVSSQCIKRAIRTSPVFRDTIEADPSIRTRYLVRELRKQLLAQAHPADEVELAATTFPQALTEKDGKPKKAKRTDVLLCIGQDEIALVANMLDANWEQVVQEATHFQADPRKAITANTTRIVKQIFREIKGQPSVPDIALFGRMLASHKDFNVDAACQVAHAISTHRITMEMDFFTAVDDLLQLEEEEEAGAAHLDFTGFNSSCFYRYARIDWGQLLQNLNGDADLCRRTVEGFLRATVEAVPSGKQNAFAAYNPPGFLLAVVRENGMAWSLTNAFEKPVRPRRDSGLMAPSVEALDAYWGRLCGVYGRDTLACVAALSVDPDASLEHLEADRVENLEQWIQAVTGALPAGQEEDA